MLLTKEDIQQFQIIYKQQFGVDLNDQQAQVEAQACLLLTQIELEPLAEVTNEK